MDFTGANLSKLDLRYINFKYAILKNSNLAGANLSYCNFERADLSHTKMDVSFVKQKYYIIVTTPSFQT